MCVSGEAWWQRKKESVKAVIVCVWCKREKPKSEVCVVCPGECINIDIKNKGKVTCVHVCEGAVRNKRNAM